MTIGTPARTGAVRAPRSGGRTAAGTAGAATAGEDTFPTQGSAALRAEALQAQRDPPAPPAPNPRLRVAPPLPVAVPRAPFILLVLLLVVGGVLGILVLNTKINENAFRLHDLQQQQATLDQHQQQLEQQLADYESPNNLAAAACRLGLVPAGAPAFIRLPDGRVIGVPQPASGQPCVSGRQATGAGKQSGGNQAAGNQSGGNQQTAAGQRSNNDQQSATDQQADTGQQADAGQQSAEGQQPGAAAGRAGR